MPATDVSTIARIGHDEAMVLTQTEFDRAVALLRALSPSDWAQPTDCDRWTVRAVALHLLGAAEANASLPEQIRQMRHGSKLKASVGSPHWWDGANEYQIAKPRAFLTTASRTTTSTSPRARPRPACGSRVWSAPSRS